LIKEKGFRGTQSNNTDTIACDKKTSANEQGCTKFNRITKINNINIKFDNTEIVIADKYFKQQHTYKESFRPSKRDTSNDSTGTTQMCLHLVTLGGVNT